MHFIYKWRKKCRFLTEDVALVCVPAPDKRVHDYGTGSSQSVLSCLVLSCLVLSCLVWDSVWVVAPFSRVLVGRRVYSGLVLLFDSVKYSFVAGSRRMTNFVWPPGRYSRRSNSAENGFFEPFIHKNDHFAKTGSGQTIGKALKKRRFPHRNGSLSDPASA
jgi:hypothetical protein